MVIPGVGAPSGLDRLPAGEGVCAEAGGHPGSQLPRWPGERAAGGVVGTGSCEAAGNADAMA